MKKFILVFLVFSLCDLVLTLSASTGQIRVGVADFIDRAAPKIEMYSIPMNLPLKQITEEFSKILISCSDKLEVKVSRSFQTQNAASPQNFADAVKSSGCQYLILGALTKLDNDLSYSYKSTLVGDIPETAIYTYNAILDVKLIEVNTGKIIFSSTGTGKASFSEKVKKTMKDIGSKKLIYERIDNHEQTQKQSLFIAASMTAEKICAFLTGEYPEITSVKKNPDSSSKKLKSRSDKKNKLSAAFGTININRGSEQGICDKSCYRVFYEGEEIFDFTGKSLGREKFNIAVAEVSSVKANYCTALVIGGNLTNIHEGDKAELITPEEARTIIDNNDFVRNRLSEFLK